MTQHKRADARAVEFFDDLWKNGDPWELETSDFEQAKYDRQLAILGDRRYGRVLEVGCGAGWFTTKLAVLSDQIVAIDISPEAIAHAQATRTAPVIDYRIVNIMDYDPRDDGPWDLILLSETIYYIGWLYPFYHVAWLASELFDTTRSGGRLLMCNTCGGVKDHLIRPWIIDTYRDLMVNVGFLIASEETYRQSKNGVDIDVRISLFSKP